MILKSTKLVAFFITQNLTKRTMLLRIHPDNPNPRELSQAVKILQDGGILIYPTDTVYALGCDIFNTRAVERIAKIKGVNPKKHDFSIICQDLSHISDFALPFNNSVFKLMKKNLPGAFTFILPASNKIPKIFKNSKKDIGIRIPDNNIPLALVKELGHPILTTSIHDEDEMMEYSTDPELIHEKYENQVDAVIDGGYGNLTASTIVNCIDDEIEVTRQGIGELIY